MKPRRVRKPPNAWQASTRWRAIGSEAIRKWNRTRHHKPKCGAARRSDGQPCQQLAMANGRCYLHGGKVPRGDQWHVTQWPKGRAPNAVERMNYKLASKQKEAAARARKLQMMPAAKKAAHLAWHKTHKPGSSKARAADRERRRQDREARAMIERARLEIAIREGEGIFG